MINRILFIGDYYRGDQDRNIKALYSLISPLFFESNIHCVPIYCEQKFSDQDFYTNSLSYHGKSVFDEFDISNEDAVIGFELNPIDIQFLNFNKINWINFEIHPIRFLDDLCFSISSSFDFKLDYFAIHQQSIKIVANTMKYKYQLEPLTLKPNSLLIIGQAPTDKSVFFDDKYKNLFDYIEEIENFAIGFDNIYYRPHPILTDKRIDDMIKERFSAESLNDQNFYHLISTDYIQGVCGISSSSLHESVYFDKSVLFLESRTKIFSKPVFIQDFLINHQIWISGLIGYAINLGVNCMHLPSNTCRDLYTYWSYISPINKIETIANQAKYQANKSEIKASEAQAKANEAEAKASEAEAKASEAEAKASEAEAKASEAEAKASEAEIRTNDALHHYHTVINSNSWKIMKPLRIIGKLGRWFYYGIYHWITFSPTSRPRRITKQAIMSLKNYINSRPKLKNKIITILNRFPKIKARLKEIGQQKDMVSSNNYQAPEYSHLTPRAQEIYHKLKLAIDEKKKSVK